MMVHAKQVFASTLLLAFGVLALLVWRRFGPVRRDRAALAWALTASNFLVVGVYSTAQSVLAAAGAAMGVKSELYLFVGRWSLAANAARGLVSVAFGVMLLVLMMSRRRWGARVVSAAPMVLISVAVLSTGPLGALPYADPYAYLTCLAVISGIIAIVLMAALFAAVHHDGLDQLLWLALAAYTLKETMSVSLMAVMAAWTMTYAATYWTVFYWVCIVLGVCMAGLAARRLQLASGGRRVPAAFEAVHALRRPAHG
jgi:hypothetical protein